MDNFANLKAAPMPTPKTLRMRKNLFFQAYRFVALNLRMIGIILKGHH